MTDAVAGAYRVTVCGLPADHHAMVESHRMQGVVSAPEVEPTAVELWESVPHKRWPRPGDVLPVFVDRADPTRIRVRWERVRRRDLSERYTTPTYVSAEKLAAEMRRHRR